MPLALDAGYGARRARASSDSCDRFRPEPRTSGQGCNVNENLMERRKSEDAITAPQQLGAGFTGYPSVDPVRSKQYRHPVVYLPRERVGIDHNDRA
jgi:hypothetical protein